MAGFSIIFILIDNCRDEPKSQLASLEWYELDRASQALNLKYYRENRDIFFFLEKKTEFY